LSPPYLNSLKSEKKKTKKLYLKNKLTLTPTQPSIPTIYSLPIYVQSRISQVRRPFKDNNKC